MDRFIITRLVVCPCCNKHEYILEGNILCSNCDDFIYCPNCGSCGEVGCCNNACKICSNLKDDDFGYYRLTEKVGKLGYPILKYRFDQEEN